MSNWNIQAYHRPDNLDEALALLARPEPLTLALGGGTVLTQNYTRSRTPLLHEQPLAWEVVDLQKLGLDGIERRGSGLTVGAATRLQTLMEHSETPPALAEALQGETSYHLRRMRTLAGVLVCADGRSPLAAALLALDALVECTWMGGKHSYPLGELLPQRAVLLRGKLITRITIPLAPALTYHYSARTPADRPLVCVAAARWPSGRLRLVLGGYGPAPVLASDGAASLHLAAEKDGLAFAAGELYRLAGDEWASAEYRGQTAAALARRCLDFFEQTH